MPSYALKIQCQVENTLGFALILRGFCGKPVDNFAINLVDKIVENRRTVYGNKGYKFVRKLLTAGYILNAKLISAKKIFK